MTCFESSPLIYPSPHSGVLILTLSAASTLSLLPFIFCYLFLLPHSLELHVVCVYVWVCFMVPGHNSPAVEFRMQPRGAAGIPWIMNMTDRGLSTNMTNQSFLPCILLSSYCPAVSTPCLLPSIHSHVLVLLLRFSLHSLFRFGFSTIVIRNFPLIANNDS